MEAVEPVTQPAPDPGRRARRDWRAVASGLLAVGAILCLFVGNAAHWMRQDVYSSASVDREAQQIVGSSDVQAAVANLVTTRVIQPILHQTAAGPWGLITDPLTKVAGQLVERTLSTQPARDVAARLVDQVVPEMQHGAGPITLSAEQLAWIVSPGLAANNAVATVLRAADRTGCCHVLLAQRQGLSFVWRHVDEIRMAGMVLPAMFVALVTLSLGLARRRRHLAMIIAASTAATGLATMGLLWAGPGFWSGLTSRPSAAAGVVHAADRTVFGSATASLRAHSLLIATVGAGALAMLAVSSGIRTRRRPDRTFV
jgi:hypothetical protein